MSRLQWDKIGERYYETGNKQAVLYPQTNGAYPKGVAWNGFSAFTLSPSGAEASPIYADDIKYLNLMSTEEMGATVEAYTYPDEFDECNGIRSIVKGVTIGQQTRKPFGLCVKTMVGNDVDYNDHAYKLNILYGALASPSEKSYKTINDSPEALSFSWELTTTPVEVSGFKPTAYLCVDSRTCEPEKLKVLEDILYGKNGTGEDDLGTEARLPLPDEIVEIIGISSVG